jgi:hypothetical protein
VDGVEFVAATGGTLSAVIQQQMANSIVAIVPQGAVTGTIQVLNSQGQQATSSTAFTVTAGNSGSFITSFSPASGSVGTQVYIQGSFTGSETAVLFNGVAAPFSINCSGGSCQSINATVPPGATTGPIMINSPNGNAVSATTFTVF